MLHVRFTTARHLTTETQETWEALVDWDDHEDWVPLTTVNVTSDDEFTAFTGVGPLKLEDRMRVVEQHFDGHSGRCRVIKQGPVLHGEATFVVLREGNGTLVLWHEDVQLPGPKWLRILARPVGTVSALMFRFALGRLEKRLCDES